MSKRSVTYSADFLTQAMEQFPLERSMRYGGPTYGEFMAGPVVGARLRFASAWGQARSVVGDVVKTVDEFSNVFGPLTFYGVLVSEDRVQMDGFDYQADYWSMIADDPEE